MGAILGVSQGSIRPGRVVIMRWNGAAASNGEATQPIAFIGKGVTFDTGGISIKPSSGMEGHEGAHGRGGLRRRPDPGPRRPQRPRSMSSAPSASSRTCRAPTPIVRVIS